MGTDIHGFVEARQILAGGRLGDWHVVEDQIFDDRDYRLFAALANVRNGHRFGGRYTHDPVKPIAEPRGLPPDMSKNSLDVGDHSFSFLTIREILDYDWDQMGVEEFLEWVGTLAQYGEPENVRLVFGFDS